MTSLPSARGDVRILLVDDHILFAETLELALVLEGYNVRRTPVPDTGGSVASLTSTILRWRPRIVLLDLDLGRFGDGVRLISPLARAGVNVVVVTASADRGRWGEAVRYGARKVLSKSRPLNEILATVRRISQGLPVMGLAERDELLDRWQSQGVEQQRLRARIDRLTRREREVLGELMEGHSVRDIAGTFVVSEATVRTQVKSVLAKLEVSSQLAAVGLAHHVGWRTFS